MTRAKAVLWDMDGTLVDSEPLAVEALRLAMAEAGLPPLPDLHDRVVGRAADDLYRWFVTDFGLSLDPLTWERRKHHHYFLAAASGLRGFAAALACWQRLDLAGVAQAVVSNSDRAIVDVNLRAVGLARPGLITVSRNDLRRGKPDPEGYLRAAWLLQVAPADCLVIEDSDSGAAAGLASGIRTLFVPHATGPVPAGATRLAEMAELDVLVAGV
jgi:beta-phosphoglucomutase-like phosphatase (HAD superfamily)